VNGTFESAQAERDGHSSNLRVLVVDDDRSNSEIVSRVLAAHGYTVDAAPNGQAALELVKQHSYRLAVVDYQMPGMNGVEFFRLARDLQPELRGVFLTAYANINTVFPAIEAGVERVLAKPLNSRELIRIADALVAPGSTPAQDVGE
jgi:CheY-like chemotaxis protein